MVVLMLRVVALLVASPSSAVVIDIFSKRNRKAIHKSMSVQYCTLASIKLPAVRQENSSGVRRL